MWSQGLSISAQTYIPAGHGQIQFMLRIHHMSVGLFVRMTKILQTKPDVFYGINFFPTRETIPLLNRKGMGMDLRKMMAWNYPRALHRVSAALTDYTLKL